jgi:hypothetical protein
LSIASSATRWSVEWGVADAAVRAIQQAAVRWATRWEDVEERSEPPPAA